jgi:hypothetical protein
MIKASSLLADSVSLQARIADALNAAKDAGDIEAYGILAAAETTISRVCNILGDPRLRDK